MQIGYNVVLFVIYETIVNILSFINECSTEKKCKPHLAKQREHEGMK